MSDLHIDFDVKCENKVNKDFTVKLVSAMREALNKVTDSIKVLEKCTKNLIGHSRLAFNNHESNIDC